MAGNETSELQAVDFALGAFMSDAFQGHNTLDGPAQWREFLSRARNKQIYRHDFDTPQEFMGSLTGARGNEKTLTGGAKLNLPSLPVMIYCRKPGFTNGEDYAAVKGKRVWDLALENGYQIRPLPLVLTYKLAFLAWDKLTLDKLQLAWYAYIAWHNMFLVTYRIGTDTFDTVGIIRGNKAVIFSDASIPGKEGRLYIVETPLEVATQVLFGQGVVVPETVTLTGVYERNIQ
jgi:hypothetical protein